MFWIPFSNHNLPIELDSGQDLYRLCGLLNPVRLPSATGNPRKLSPVISANPQERTHFLSDSRRIQGLAAPLVASCPLPPLSWSAKTLLIFPKHTLLPAVIRKGAEIHQPGRHSPALQQRQHENLGFS